MALELYWFSPPRKDSLDFERSAQQMSSTFPFSPFCVFISSEPFPLRMITSRKRTVECTLLVKSRCLAIPAIQNCAVFSAEVGEWAEGMISRGRHDALTDSASRACVVRFCLTGSDWRYQRPGLGDRCSLLRPVRRRLCRGILVRRLGRLVYVDETLVCGKLEM